MNTSSESERAVIQNVYTACSTHYQDWTDANFDTFFAGAGEIKIAHVGEASLEISSITETEDVIGIALYYPPQTYTSRGDEICVRIQAFGINPDVRRQGYGTQFVYRLTQKWFLSGATYLWCLEHKTNRDCVTFWESLGFRHGRLPDTADSDFLYLEKSLCQNL